MARSLKIWQPFSTHLVALGHLEVGRGEEKLGREVLLLLVDLDVALLVAAGKSVKRESRALDVSVNATPIVTYSNRHEQTITPLRSQSSVSAAQEGDWG